MKKQTLTLLFILFTSMLYAQTQGDLERQLINAGLVDVAKLDTTLRVKLIYSCEDNFVGCDMYGDLERAYLLPHFAKKLIKASKILRKLRPGYRLLIYDAARPISVQRKMRALAEGTPNEIYVASGEKGGRHNFGVAVDLTILNAKNEPIDMGTKVDHLGVESHLDNMPELIKTGKITAEAAKNRTLLVNIMKQAGLVPYRREWWHFEETMPMSKVRTTYKLINF